MKPWTINILFPFVDGPWGGGNQFLKGLRNYFVDKGVYDPEPNTADVVLFNSHQALGETAEVKRAHPGKLLVHRVDGPVSLLRDKDPGADRLIFASNSAMADATVFQSHWSERRCRGFGLADTPYHAVITNAPDPELFFPLEDDLVGEERVRLIATSWSAGRKKGFSIYQYLDENLDFSKYSMTFIGNSPVRFRNIRMEAPLPSAALAERLRDHEIYITASEDDPCSNALIEALHCGLPVVAQNSGGHPEIAKGAAEFFTGPEDVVDAIDKVAGGLAHYRSSIDVPTIEDVGGEYSRFIDQVQGDCLSGRYVPKRLSVWAKTRLSYQVNRRTLGAFARNRSQIVKGLVRR